jgi:hypothetical protein
MMQNPIGLPPLLAELYEQLEALRLHGPEAFERYEPLHVELQLINRRIARSPAMETPVEAHVRRRHTGHFRIMVPDLPSGWGHTTTTDQGGEVPFTYVVGPWPPSQPVTKCPNCGHPLP